LKINIIIAYQLILETKFF